MLASCAFPSRCESSCCPLCRAGPSFLRHPCPGPVVGMCKPWHSTPPCLRPCTPGGSLCYCTCTQEAIRTKSAGSKWLVSGLQDHRYLSVTKNATRRRPAGGTPTSVQQPCSGTTSVALAKQGPLDLPYDANEFMYVEITSETRRPPPPRAEAPRELLVLGPCGLSAPIV